MTLKQLQAFYWAAHLGNFSIAAVRANVTQSSLSKRIAELEDVVGTQLFDRSSKKVQLTDAGHRLLPLAGKMLQLMDSMQSEVLASSTLTGVCRFGISELAALTWLPRFVSDVRREYPQLRLEPYVDLARHLEKRVFRGELDFAVAPGPGIDPAINSEVVADVDFTWAAAPARLKRGTILTPEDILKHPLITMTEGSGLTRAFESWASEQGIRAQQTLACNSLMAIVGLTVADMGISFLPTNYIQPWVQSGSLVSLKSVPPLPTLGYCFVRRTDDTRLVVQAMKRLIVQNADFSQPAQTHSPKVALASTKSANKSKKE